MQVQCIHPTKTGGTSLYRFLETIPGISYSGDHSVRVPDALASGHVCVVTIRDPIERAKSIYRYYRGGSEIPGRVPVGHWPPLDFESFWCRVALGHPPPLPRRYMYDDHLKPQIWWFGDDWRTVIQDPRVHIIRNDGHLRDVSCHVLRTLGIDVDPGKWKTVNVSTYTDPIIVSGVAMEAICTIFRDDIELWSIKS